ncbi:MAG: hypothetical protein HZA08_01710 [Nitrospirae bacterium]|nr:hypothetical protein [Nitrospirota bacterium]
MEYRKSYYSKIFVKQRFELDESEYGEWCFMAMMEYQGKPEGVYNPWQQLQDSKKSKKVVPPYIEFASLDPENTEELLNYANNRGIPSSAPDIIGHSLDYTASRIALENKCDGMSPDMYFLKDFCKDILKMKALLFLIHSLTISEDLLKIDSERLGNILQCICQLNELGKRESKILEKRMIEDVSFLKYNIESSLQKVFDDELKGLQPTFNILPTGKLEGCLLYKNLKQALYATLFDDITTPVSICADPKCRRFFTIDHKGKMYCSKRCAYRVSQQNFQNRKRINGDSNHGKKTR